MRATRDDLARHGRTAGTAGRTVFLSAGPLRFPAGLAPLLWTIALRSPVLVLFAALLAHPLAAQVALDVHPREPGPTTPRPWSAPPAHAIDQWTTEDGLPQNSVNAIVEAPDGHLWLGTFGGLVRFDGTRFTLVERVDSAGRHIDRVHSLAVAPDGGLWIGTEAGSRRVA
ncbi:MAG: two-component regulator propeller domain-containing protein [Gemmatimonadota bacterium]